MDLMIWKYFVNAENILFLLQEIHIVRSNSISSNFYRSFLNNYRLEYSLVFGGCHHPYLIPTDVPAVARGILNTLSLNRNKSQILREKSVKSGSRSGSASGSKSGNFINISLTRYSMWALQNKCDLYIKVFPAGSDHYGMPKRNYIDPS